MNWKTHCSVYNLSFFTICLVDPNSLLSFILFVFSTDKSGDFVGRSAVARRPIRKLPAPPKRTSHANVVKLNTGSGLGSGSGSGSGSGLVPEVRKQRSLPAWPSSAAQEKQNENSKENSVSGRLSNFFRSVKFTRYIHLI